MELLDIRPRRPELPASALSGGNQQKVILAKSARKLGVLLLDQHTAAAHGKVADDGSASAATSTPCVG